MSDEHSEQAEWGAAVVNDDANPLTGSTFRRSEPMRSQVRDISGRAVPDTWGTALTVAGAVGAVVVVRKILRR